MRRVQLSFLVVVFLGVENLALAASTNGDNREREARMACLSGDPAKGVALLSALFVDTKDPTYIYNQGRCFEQNRRFEEAIGRFEEYQRVAKNASPSDKADAEKHIAECEALLAKQRSQEVSRPSASQTASSAEERPTGATAESPVVREKAQPARVGTGALLTAGIVTAAVGGAAVVAGIVFNVKANSLASDMNKVDGYTAAKESSRSTYQTLGWVGYGVGAACIAGGVLMVVLGLHASGTESSSPVAFVPAVGPDRASLLLRGAF